MKNLVNTEYLKKVRKEKGFSYRKMSELLGAKSSATYFNIENGKSEPKASQILKISEILKIPVKKILAQ